MIDLQVNNGVGLHRKRARAMHCKPGKDRDLPHSIEAEMGTLGSMISDPMRCVPVTREKINEEFFYVPAHRILFNALLSMFENEGAVDLITFTQYLREVGQLETVGGPPFVTSLFTFVPNAANVGYYIDILRDKYLRREMIAANTEYARRAYEEQDGVDRLLREFGQHAERMVGRAITGRSRLPPVRDLSMMIGDNLPPKPAELVKGVLHQGSKIIVGGTSKGRKTFALLDLAISVATGTPWWGFETVPGPVCYINFEIQEPFFAGRADDICRAKSKELGRDLVLPPNMLHVWNLRGHAEGIENMVEELLVVLRQWKLVLILFDPIYKGLGNRDENKAGDVASMLNELERIAVRTAAAVAFGAHYSKGNQAAKESIDRIGGSGVFARDPDSILTMTAHQEPEAFTVEATLRNFKPIEPFVVRWEWPLFSRDDSLDPDALKKPRNKGGRPADATENAEELLELLNDRNLRYGEFKRAAEKLGIKEKTFEKYFTILKRTDRIIKIAEMWTKNREI